MDRPDAYRKGRLQELATRPIKGPFSRIPKRVSTWDTRQGAGSLASNRLVPTRMLVA